MLVFFDTDSDTDPDFLNESTFHESTWKLGCSFDATWLPILTMKVMKGMKTVLRRGWGF